MLTKTIISHLEDNYQALIDWLSTYPEKEVNIEKVTGKWTAAQHIDHLIRCTQPLNKALRLPKQVLEEKFGKMDRAEMTYEELVAKYKGFLQQNMGKGLVGPARYAPDLERKFSKQELLESLKAEIRNLTEILSKWEEQDLSTYVIPHPAIGNLSAREIVFHAIYHCEHHLKPLKEKH